MLRCFRLAASESQLSIQETVELFRLSRSPSTLWKHLVVENLTVTRSWRIDGTAAFLSLSCLTVGEVKADNGSHF